MSRPYAVAARCLKRVIYHGETLDNVLDSLADTERERPKVQALCYDGLRWYWHSLALIQPLLKKPLRDKDGDVMALLIIATQQLVQRRQPDHAIVNAAVAACNALKKSWGRGLVNAVLRTLGRERDSRIEALSPLAASAHPEWLYHALVDAWPAHIPQLFDANNAHPPMTLRINRQQQGRDEYLQRLQSVDRPARSCPLADHAVTLQEACDVSALPGFSSGAVSVQDEAAQLTAGLLDLQAGQSVLDACAAPGGKTGLLLETEPDIQLTAVDISQPRLARVQDNLSRLQLDAKLLCGDAANPALWGDDSLYDRILADVPCSGTGVLRRHPDIRVLRRDTDIVGFNSQQRAILEGLWPRLRQGGKLLYATCSILPAENHELVADFLASHADARVEALPMSGDAEVPHGLQLLPVDGGHDGFYYCIMSKTESNDSVGGD